MQEDEIYVVSSGYIGATMSRTSAELSRDWLSIQVQEYLAKGGKITVADQGEIGLEKSHPHSFDRRFLVK
jgi:hypothetical protein